MPNTKALMTGYDMPVIGLGTWPMLNAEAADVVAEALRIGYRMVDTAARYSNEAGVGRGIAASGIPRHELFVCTKLRGADHGEALTPRAIDGSLAKLGVDYLDLYLIHWPLPQLDLYVDSWRAMDVARREGLIRSIGVSNFLPEHLDRLMAETGVVPAVNQIECHPYFTQDAALEFHAKHGIVTMAWSPLGRGKELRDPVVVEIAEAHGVTPAQVVLRWHIQRGCVPIPKSSSPARLRENLDVFGFELTEEEMGRITGLNRNSVYMDPATHDER